MSWSFGVNKHVPVHNLSDGNRKVRVKNKLFRQESVLIKESSSQIRCFLMKQLFGFQVALFVCAHVGVMFDWEGNKQQLLQGHVSFTLVLGYCI